MKKRNLLTMLATTLFVTVATAGPQGGDHGHDAHASHNPAADQAATTELSDGEVRKIDKETGKITLKHGEIKNLDMPSMTMVFQVKDKALLDKVQPGDKVRFKAETENGNLVVTEIQPAM